MNQIREQLTQYFLAGVQAASAAETLTEMLPRGAAAGRTIVLGCGKAAAAMAEVAAQRLSGDVVGSVVTRYGHSGHGSTGRIEVIEASHPVPDAASLAAGQRIRQLAESARTGDRVIFLISGGGSALLCDPIEGVSLDEKARITRHLVRSGVSIGEINLVRRHLSRVKGGRLAAAASAADDMHSFLISDVVADCPSAIASGPSIGSTFEPDKALEILSGSGWDVTPDLAESLRAAGKIEVPEHPVHIIANGRTALDAIAQRAERDGWQVVRLGDELDGDAAELGRRHAALAMELTEGPGHHLLLSGGEVTVRVRSSDGSGGPNLEYLTSLMAALPVGAPIAALACDSDGIDGSEDNAGGYFDAAHRAAVSVCEGALAANRSYDLFAGLGGLIMTGPTRTNVNDIRMIAVGAVE
jgi:glycerate 2-kinase